MFRFDCFCIQTIALVMILMERSIILAQAHHLLDHQQQPAKKGRLTSISIGRWKNPERKPHSLLMYRDGTNGIGLPR